jgi:hypothetical protein
VWSHSGAVDRTTQRRVAVGSPTDQSRVLSPAEEPARVQTEQRHELPTKVRQAGRNLFAGAGGRRSAPGHLGVTRVDRAVLRCPLPQGIPGAGWRGLGPRSGPSISSKPPGLDRRRRIKRFARCRIRPPVEGFKLARTQRGRPGSTHAETPIGEGAVCRTVATGCAGSTPGRGTTPAPRDVRSWQGATLAALTVRVRPHRLHQHHPCPCSSGDRAPV